MLIPFRSTLAALHPRRFPYLRFSATVLLGLGSGWLFQFFNIPLPWMLGPLCACTLAALAHIPVSAPAAMRPPILAMIGLMLGGSFTPQMLGNATQWLSTLALQLLLLLLLAAIGIWYYRRIGKLDPVTAYYAGMPGGMVEMSLMGEEQGGDGQAVILIHSSRILFIILTVPFVVQAIEHVQLGPRQASRLSVLDAPPATFLWLVGLGFAGAVLARRARMPASGLFGPMFASIAAHASGITDFVVPREIIIISQVMLGCVTGCRFLGYPRRQILRILALSFGATALMLTTMLAFSYGVSWATGTPVAAAILAYAPAGITEMALVALALHFDAAFVIVHQLVRVLLVASCAGLVFRWLGWGEDTRRQ